MSCFGGRDEQIYLAEILIDKLTLTPLIIKDIGEHPIVIKIRFLDLPIFEFTHGDDARRDQDVRFMTGRCCLFVRRPQDLVRELRSMNVKIGVFCKDDTYPVEETELTLPGCTCDQLAMIGNDPQHLPKPFTVKGGFHLLDPGKNPSGTVYMELAVVCLGRMHKTHYELHPIDTVTSPVVNEEEKKRRICLQRFVPADLLEKARAEEVVHAVKEKPPEKKEKKRKKKKGKKK